MQNSTPEAIRLSDYKSPEYTTEAVELHFELNDDATEVTSTLTVQRQAADADSLVLDGEDLELLEVAVDGRVLSSNEYQVDAASLTLFGLAQRHQITLKTRIYPHKNTALEGLYRSSQMYCTQCEAQGFRKITYYQDRPDVQAVFSTTIVADAGRYPTLLANGNLQASRQLDDGRLQVSWHDPFPKPSYLFALVAGDLQVLEDTFTTMSGRQIVLQIFSEPHNIGQCDYAMDVLKRSMAWDEQGFGREYDLDIFMIVAVEDFNMGAMENKGLNIFNTSCVLASKDTATDAAYLRVEAVVAHEYFHNWSGNRVTCRDWFQLSLKEGFTVFRDAEFTSDMNSRAVKRIEDVSFLRSVQFAEDAGPLAHPVRPQSYIEISNFYTTTIYEKGAEVVRMYQTLLGEQNFRRATDLYFDRFDGSAATTDDFAAVMAEVGGIDLGQFKRWYEQAGTPVLTVTESFADGYLQLQIQQACPPTPGQADKQPFHMPVELGLLDAAGESLQLTDVQITCAAQTSSRRDGESLLVELREASTRLQMGPFTDKPVVSFLREFSSPVRVQFQRPQQELALLVGHDTDGFVRWDSLQSLWLAYFRGQSGVDLAALLGEIAARVPDMQSAEEKQLAAMMLSVPDANYLFEQLGEFDVDEVLNRRDAALDEVASRNLATWQTLYAAVDDRGPYSPDSLSMANRSLLNLGLGYICRAVPAAEAAMLLRRHYDAADNLTNRRGALAVAMNVAHIDAGLRQTLLTEFYDAWQNEALVIDLWFNLQAQADSTGVEQLRQLEAHASFNPQNPNRARSLYAAFGMLNHRNFHALDGSGYRYLGEVVGRLDAVNPQLATRLATPLTRWRRYDPARRKLMRAQLQNLAGQSDMSKDLFEIVSKALGDD